MNDTSYICRFAPDLSLREVFMGTNGAGLLASRQLRSPSQAKAQWRLSELHDSQSESASYSGGAAPDLHRLP